MNNFVITFDMLLNLPKELLKKSAEYNDYSELLKKDIFLNYDCKKLKQDINEKFDHYKKIKYLHKLPNSFTIKSPTFDLIGKSKKNISDRVGDSVANNVDEEIWIYDFYNCLLVVASKLTNQESRYLVDTFFGNKPENVIFEKLGICKNTFLNVKKSCLVKLWLELQNLD